MPTPNRLFYAVQQVGFAQLGSNTFSAAHGVQSVGITTSFNLTQVFQLGEIQIYHNIEGVPDIEITMEKVLDGYCPLFLKATKGATGTGLSGRSAVKSIIGLSLFGDTQNAASGTPVAQMVCSGMVPSQISYRFPIDGNYTEAVTFVGNNKTWVYAAPFTFSGAFTNTDSPLAISNSGGVQQRKDMLFATTVPYSGAYIDANNMLADPNCTILPCRAGGIPGISASGTNNRNSAGEYGAHVQSITISTNLGREPLFEQGRKAPFFRFATFPTEVTCEIETTSTSGDLVQATEAGIINQVDGTNLYDQSIRIATHEGLRLNLGVKNKLSSVSETGGDAGGGNVTTTYSYTTFNDLYVSHWNDDTTSIAPAQL